MLQKPGEADLLGKLKQHQLQQEDGGYLPNRSRPATGRRRQRLRAVDGQLNQRRSDRNGEQ